MCGERNQAFLDILEVTGGFSVEQDVFMKTRFLSKKNYEKNCKTCSTTSGNTTPNPLERTNRYCLLEKFLNPLLLTQFSFHRIRHFWNANSVEVSVSKNVMFNSLERSFSRKKPHICSKCDEDDDIRSWMRWSLNEIVTESSRVQCELCCEDCNNKGNHGEKDHTWR